MKILPTEPIWSHYPQGKIEPEPVLETPEELLDIKVTIIPKQHPHSQLALYERYRKL